MTLGLQTDQKSWVITMRLFVNLLLLTCISVLTACGGGGDNNRDNGTTQGNEGSFDPARNLAVSLKQGQTVTIDLARVPLPEGASLSIASQPSHGSASIQSSNAVYSPDPDYYGTDTFSYNLALADGASNRYDVTLTIEQTQSVPAAISTVRVATWKGNARAAYSIVHDDFCSGDFDKSGLVKYWHQLADRGLVAGYGVIVQLCNYQPKYYEEMQKMVAAGMEMINHTFSHPAPDKGFDQGLLSPGVNLDQELVRSHQELHNHGFDAQYFVFPLDKSNNAILRTIADEGYKGARGGAGQSINNANLNPNDDLAPFKANFDCFNIHQTDEVSCSKHRETQIPQEILKRFLDDAIADGGWALRELHGIEDNPGLAEQDRTTADSWGWVSLKEYSDHLDYVKSRVESGDVWMDTPTHVTLYWASRAYCGEPSIKGNGKLEFDNYQNGAGCIKYSTPLDVIVTVDDADTLSASQDGASLPVTKLGDHRFLMPVNPTGGEVSVLRPQI